MKLTGMYTAAGAQLAARAQAEETALVITRAAAGSGLTETSASAMVKEEQALDLQGKSASGQNATVAATLCAALAEQVYPLREVGLYARIGQEGEVLYKLFRLDENLTVENDTDLTVTFYLTETILQADQVQVEMTPHGLVTEQLCLQIAGQQAALVESSLNAHKTGPGAHSAHQITGGTLAGQVAAQSNENYAAAQVRNIVLSANEPSGGQNGELWFKYSS